jgi:hypothetical protein
VLLTSGALDSKIEFKNPKTPTGETTLLVG